MRTRAKAQTEQPAAPVSPSVLPQTHNSPVADRLARGKALRECYPRKAQAEWKPPAKRADPNELLIENSRGRIEDLIPIRYGRMLANPFAFYRGAAVGVGAVCAGRSLQALRPARGGGSTADAGGQRYVPGLVYRA